MTHTAPPSAPVPSDRRAMTRQRPVPACLLSRSDFLRLCEQLNSKLQEQAATQILQLVRPSDYSVEEFEELKRSIKDVSQIYVRVTATDGESISGIGPNVIKDLCQDMGIQRIYIDSKVTFEAKFNISPPNQFWILLDFSKSAVFDLVNPVSQSTPNASLFEISGEDDTWIRAVYDQIKSSFESKKTRRTWLHRQGIYDLFLLILAVPITVLILWKLSKVYDVLLPNSHIVIDIIVGVYGAIILLNLYRFIFGYTKWIFPLVELTDVGRKEAGRHRKSWWILILGIAATVLATFLL